jgi:hypothetical protein
MGMKRNKKLYNTPQNNHTRPRQQMTTQQINIAIAEAFRSELCLERETRKRAEAEVDRLKEALIACLKITSIYDSNGDYETALDNVYDIAANALKTQDNQ